jgi:hypothetical protein
MSRKYFQIKFNYSGLEGTYTPTLSCYFSVGWVVSGLDMRFWRENREKNLSMHPWAKQAGLTQYCVLEQGEGYSGQAQFSACHAEPTPESRIGAR